MRCGNVQVPAMLHTDCISIWSAAARLCLIACDTFSFFCVMFAFDARRAVRKTAARRFG